MTSTLSAADTGLPSAPHVADLLPFARRPPTIPTADDDEPRRPARLMVFPPPSAERCRAFAAQATAVAERLDSGHVDLLVAIAELLELDDLSFSARMRHMRTDDVGRALLSELLTTIQTVSVDFDRASRALFVVRARLTANLGNTGGSNG